MTLPVLEFWPDYGDGPLWAAGAAVDPVAVGVDADLAAHLAAHNEAYEEERLPLDGPGDVDYLAEGTRLRGALRHGVVDDRSQRRGSPSASSLWPGSGSTALAWNGREHRLLWEQRPGVAPLQHFSRR